MFQKRNILHAPNFCTPMKCHSRVFAIISEPLVLQPQPQSKEAEVWQLGHEVVEGENGEVLEDRTTLHPLSGIHL